MVSLSLSLAYSCLTLCNEITQSVLLPFFTPVICFCVCVLIDLIVCTIIVRDPVIFTSCMDCGSVLRVVRFVMKCKSGTTFLEIGSDLASTIIASFECK